MQGWVDVGGRVGLLTKYRTKQKVQVQFGSGGPFEMVWEKHVHPANEAQIRDKEGTSKC